MGYKPIHGLIIKLFLLFLLRKVEKNPKHLEKVNFNSNATSNFFLDPLWIACIIISSWIGQEIRSNYFKLDLFCNPSIVKWFSFWLPQELHEIQANHDLRNCHPFKILTYFVMIVLVHLPSECAYILHYFSLTKMYRQRQRVVYQIPFAYDLALLFITSMRPK